MLYTIVTYIYIYGKDIYTYVYIYVNIYIYLSIYRYNVIWTFFFAKTLFLPRKPWQELVGVLGLELRFETTTVPQKKRRVTGMGQIIEAPGITD